MTEKLPVSVFIISKNEEDRIPYTIRSVINWADEVIVIDSGSDDNTVQISQELGATVIHNDWPGYGPQKIFGERQCRNDWVLNLDADEELNSELISNIKILFRDSNLKHSSYHITRKIMFMHENEPPFLAPGDRPIRLYQKSKAGYKDSTVHDSVVVHEGSTGAVKGLIHHRCFRSFEHWCHKLNFYSSMQAKDYLQQGRKPSALRLIFEPTLAFWKAYLLRRWCLYGLDGIIAARLYAHGRMLRMAKIHELNKRK